MSKIKPFKMKKMNKKLTAMLKNSLENSKGAPIDKLKEEAISFEKMMLLRRENRQ